MLLHPRKPQDYWLLCSDCDQEGDVLLVQSLVHRVTIMGLMSLPSMALNFRGAGVVAWEAEFQHRVMVYEVVRSYRGRAERRKADLEHLNIKLE